MNTSKQTLTSTEVQKQLRRGLILEYLSIGWMSVEGTASVLAGVFSGSLALLAFGEDSLIELLSAYAVASYLRRRERGKADSEILRKTERITGALLVALIPNDWCGCRLLLHCRSKSRNINLRNRSSDRSRSDNARPVLGKKRIGEETNCQPLSIDAIESATCFLMSISLLGGLLGVYLFGLWWIDSLATGIILAFVAREAIETFGESHDGRE